MISEKIILRTNPLFAFEFLEEGFHVTDESKDNTNRFYEYKIIKDVEHKSKSINWFGSIINYFALVLGFSGDTDIQIDGYQIRFKYDNENVIILTEHCEYKTVIEISERINNKTALKSTRTNY